MPYIAVHLFINKHTDIIRMFITDKLGIIYNGQLITQVYI